MPDRLPLLRADSFQQTDRIFTHNAGVDAEEQKKAISKPLFHIDGT